jgi:hypothetical protein
MVKKFIRNPALISNKANISQITKKNTMRKLETKKRVIRGNNRAVPLVRGSLHNPKSGNFATKRRPSRLD